MSTVTVTGTPALSLNDNEVAYYAGGSGTNALSFVYVPIPTDNAADLQVIGLNLPAGASIQDANCNSLSGPVAGDLGLTITGPVTPATVAQEVRRCSTKRRLHNTGRPKRLRLAVAS